MAGASTPRVGTVEANQGQIDPQLRIGGVTLAVSDLSRSVEFYERVLGLPVLTREGDERALLGQDGDRPALELTQISDPVRVPTDSTGLFHVAWLHPSRAGLAASVLRVAQQRWPLEGASDHGVSEAVYLSDPDGLGIELYVDRPRASWERPADGRGVVMYTAPLDLEDLLTHATADAAGTIENGTAIGHVHLKVSDVARAVQFYRDALGFEEQARIPSAAFLSAGAYHHHVGLNSWQSQGGLPPGDGAPGLRSVEFCLSDPGEIDAIAARVRQSAGEDSPAASSDGGLNLRDPDGVLLRFVSGVG
jgi:catechol 2,3-dioxygenase